MFVEMKIISPGGTIQDAAFFGPFLQLLSKVYVLQIQMNHVQYHLVTQSQILPSLDFFATAVKSLRSADLSESYSIIFPDGNL